MAREMSVTNENQRGRKNKAYAAIKTDMEEKERLKKRTRSNKVMQRESLKPYLLTLSSSKK